MVGPCLDTCLYAGPLLCDWRRGSAGVAMRELGTAGAARSRRSANSVNSSASAGRHEARLVMVQTVLAVTVPGVSVETPCERFHEPLPRKRTLLPRTGGHLASWSWPPGP